MIIPDPNFFSGDILVSKRDNEWQTINNDDMLLGIPNKIDNKGYKIANYRGIGLSDMIDSIANKRIPRCSLDLSLHVLEVMEGIISSAEVDEIYNISTKPEKPLFLNERDIAKFKNQY